MRIMSQMSMSAAAAADGKRHGQKHVRIPLRIVATRSDLSGFMQSVHATRLATRGKSGIGRAFAASLGVPHAALCATSFA